MTSVTDHNHFINIYGNWLRSVLFVEWTSVSPSTHTQRPIYSMLFYGNRKFVFFIKYDELSMNKVRQLIQVCALSIGAMPFGPVRRRCGDTVGGGDKWSIQYSVLKSVSRRKFSFATADIRTRS